MFPTWKKGLFRFPSLIRQCSHLMYKSTIFALSSGHGKCGVSIIRISGPETINILKLMTCYPNKSLPKPRYASLRNIVDPETQDVLDEGLCLWFPSPHSFTGEDSCEFQIHGSIAVINAILKSLNKISGVRPANPGEFSKRAFYNNKLDLTQVEALSDLINSETEIQRQKSIDQMKGNLKIQYTKWRKNILECLASVEAYIDFSEDELIEDDVLDITRLKVAQLKSDIENHIQISNKCGVRIRNGIKTVLIGEPNVGKSSLMNYLCQKEISIVTNVPGTTRDILEKHLDIQGYPVILLDTAGLRQSTKDYIEGQGIVRARKEIELSDLILILIPFNENLIKNFNQTIENYVQNVIKIENNIHNILIEKQNENLSNSNDKRYLIIINKIDLATSSQQQIQLKNQIEKYNNVVTISCIENLGLIQLMESIHNELILLCGTVSRETLTFTQSRHSHYLESCIKNLNEFLKLSQNEFDLTCSAQELRYATYNLGCITGEIRTDDVLDVIFENFCIGK